MLPDSAATTSTPAPQPAAPGSQASPAPQPSSAPPAAQPTPVQLFWEVARLAFVLMTRLIQVLQPIQSYYLAQSRQAMRVCTELCRVMLTIRFAPERITQTQLRHLTRARHILQALFNYTLPLGPRTSPSATATINQHPSASTKNATLLGARTPSSATTPSPAVAAVPEVPEVPEVPGVASPKTPAAVSSHTPSSPAVDRGHLTPDPSHSSHDSHPSHVSHSPHSALRAPHLPFSPYIPDANTLIAAVRATTLPPNCAGALVDDPGEALVRALHELHAVYFSLYPNQPPTPAQSSSPSQSQSSFNPQSTIRNPQSGTPQSDTPSVHPGNPVNTVNNVHSVHPVHSPSPAQSEISNLKSEIPNPQSDIPHSEFHIPHSSAPP